ncbi:MAG: PSD1 and planctomycete cytochrome C domain-containing protein, partial [Verrucomicrobia bacterium]|nr:PSD1 and planctomycete cytochrome C domain-containing protein [Verrucomicrobiota bacterium]
MTIRLNQLAIAFLGPLVGLVSCVWPCQVAVGNTEFFEKKIRPIFIERCYECHSAAGKIKGGLRLDTQAGFSLGGESGMVVQPGSPSASRLFEAISYANVDLQMPPKTKLPDSEIQLISQWIEMGAAWPADLQSQPGESSNSSFDLAKRLAAHWWKSPPIRPQLPPAQAHAHPRNAIDLFIGEKLSHAGLSPAAEADKPTLIRRLFFDLTGLPPSPEDMIRWMPSGQSIDALIDELLRSPAYGEKWAQHWLDLTRYAETLGHEFDYTLPNAWKYRDYLIRAINADVPYDQFVLEHVAGDCLDQPRRNPSDNSNESVIGTSFYWLGQQVHSPVDLLGNQAEVTDNQVDVLTKSFLGLTVSCARCHDHKFDAISTRDYYALFGSLTSSRYHQSSIDSPEIRGGHIQQIRSLRTQLAHEIPKHFTSQLDQLKVEMGILQNLFASNTSSESSDVLYDDFESGSFAGKWQVEGDAFGIRPLKVSEAANYQGDMAAIGQYLVNSHNRPLEKGVDTSSDSRKGSLTSEAIPIHHHYLHCLLGGGAHKNRTGIQLLLDNEVVFHQAGKNENRLHPVTINLALWQGKTLKLKIIDDHPDGWGNVGVDHIVFSNSPVYFSPSTNQPLGISGDLAQLSERHGIPIQRLSALATSVVDGMRKESGHPLRLFSDSVLNRGQPDSSVSWPDIGPGMNADSFSDWKMLEEAFDDALVSTGDLVFDGDDLSFAVFPGIHSGKMDPRLEGTASGPTFVIDKPFLHVLCSGKDARINVVMENFNMIRGPIYDDIKKKPNWIAPRWMTFNLSMWVGSDAYLQINDFAEADLAGPGSSARATGAVYKVVLSDHLNPPQAMDGTGQGGFWERTASAMDSLRQNAQSLNPAQAEWINALIQSQLLSPSANPEIQEVLAKIRRLSDEMPSPSRVPSMVEGYGRDEYVHIRGNPRNRGPKASRGFMEGLVRVDEVPQSSSGRYEFAQWLLSDANPLTARVYVNRIWYHLFGEGLVKTVDDMGIMGQVPTHPELLDWLADWFRS